SDRVLSGLMSGRVDLVAQAARYAVGVRRLAGKGPDLEGSRRRVGDEWRRRNARFLESMDALVWSRPISPYVRLLSHAGLAAGDVRHLVTTEGLEGALERLRDSGV